LVQTALDTNHPGEIERIGHMLKGTLLNLSAVKASELAGGLEQAGRSRSLQDAQPMLNQLTLELDRVVHVLNSLCPENAK
jgi:HPt (histidine-containing phosphotransfer) domain-containing protein